MSFLTTHRRKLSFPIKGTLALHCQVARLVSESFLMLVRIVSESRRRRNKILCHSTQSSLSMCIATMESVSLCVPMKSRLRLWNWKSRFES